MKKTDFSPQFPTVWGAEADSAHLQYPIPGTSSSLGRASLNLGFPPETFVAPEAGGSFMFGEDMNGALRMLATAAQNYESGVVPPFSAAFAQSVGGYPQGCIVADPNTSGGFWISTADNNLTTPGVDGAAWANLLAPYATVQQLNSVSELRTVQAYTFGNAAQNVSQVSASLSITSPYTRNLVLNICVGTAGDAYFTNVSVSGTGFVSNGGTVNFPPSYLGVGTMIFGISANAPATITVTATTNQSSSRLVITASGVLVSV